MALLELPGLLPRVKYRYQLGGTRLMLGRGLDKYDFPDEVFLWFPRPERRIPAVTTANLYGLIGRAVRFDLGPTFPIMGETWDDTFQIIVGEPILARLAREFWGDCTKMRVRPSGPKDVVLLERMPHTDEVVFPPRPNQRIEIRFMSIPDATKWATRPIPFKVAPSGPDGGASTVLSR